LQGQTGRGGWWGEQRDKGQLELDKLGYIVTDKRQRTGVPGVFAAGEVQDAIFRQVVTAAGTGSAAAIEAIRFLDEQKCK